ncbi:MAG: type II toxin-antitoxin system HicA family toxin [Saprospiraceae bacterium]
MNLSPRLLIRLLHEHGWELDRIKGSHHIFIHKESKRTLPIPIHGNKDLKMGTYKSILKIAGIKM